MDKRRLCVSAFTKFFSGLLLVGLLLFLPAGTLRYPNAWLFIVLLFVPMFIVGLFMMSKKPELLAKRLNMKEKESEQRSVIALSALVFVAGFILAALDFRFGWLALPSGVVIAAALVMLAAYALYFEVLRENIYLSRTVEVQENQRVVDTGLYGVVRHPMYAATILLYLAIPLVLGSLFSMLVFLFYIPIIVKRIRNEEKVLEEGLEGYREYEQKVRFRLMPYIW